MYNCVGGMLLGYSMGVMLGVIIGGDTRWKKRISVGMKSGGATVDSMDISDDVRVRLQLDFKFNKKWGSG